MRKAQMLAVACTALCGAIGGCAVERSDSEVEVSLSDAPALAGHECDLPLVVWVNSEAGGSVTCDGLTVKEFSSSAKITGICADCVGFTFQLSTLGPADVWVRNETTGAAVPLKISWEGSAGTDSYFDVLEAGTYTIVVP